MPVQIVIDVPGQMVLAPLVTTPKNHAESCPKNPPPSESTG
jgi:hypothetical protein